MHVLITQKTRSIGTLLALLTKKSLILTSHISSKLPHYYFLQYYLKSLSFYLFFKKGYIHFHSYSFDSYTLYSIHPMSFSIGIHLRDSKHPLKGKHT